MLTLLQLVRASYRVRTAVIVLSAGWFLVALVLLTIDPIWIFLLVAGTILTIIASAFPRAALLLMALTYPFTYVEVLLGPLNVPVVDAIGLLAFAGWVLRSTLLIVNDPKHVRSIDWWGLPIFVMWIVVALISTAQTYSDQLLALKYALRPVGFFYLVFVLFPINVINSRQTIQRVLWILYGLGVAVSLYGLYGFVWSLTNPSLPHRVIPIELFGLSPLGYNHNLIADMMLATIPIGFYLLFRAEFSQQKKWIFIGCALMILTVLFTFSRTGWLGVLLELGIFLIYEYRNQLKIILRSTVIVFCLTLPAIIYMLYFSFDSEAVRSSNQNRLLLNDVTLSMVAENPLFGTGPGTFMEHVALNRIYITEFGAPLDAHGFVQKIIGEMGLLGLSTYCVLLLYVLYSLTRVYMITRGNTQDGFLMLSLLVLAYGSIFAQLFQTSYFIGKLWFPLGVALAAARYIEREYKIQRT